MADKRCERCGKVETLDAPFVDGTCEDCLRRQLPVPKAAPPKDVEPKPEAPARRARSGLMLLLGVLGLLSVLMVLEVMAGESGLTGGLLMLVLPALAVVAAAFLLLAFIVAMFIKVVRRFLD